MALRSLSVVLALGLVITSGCKSTSSNYRPACPPAVVATTPVQPACAPGQLPAPPPIAVVPPPPVPIVPGR